MTPRPAPQRGPHTGLQRPMLGSEFSRAQWSSDGRAWAPPLLLRFLFRQAALFLLHHLRPTAAHFAALPSALQRNLCLLLTGALSGDAFAGDEAFRFLSGDMEVAL
ncbi:hypothetical protein NDU88_003786 [Pleurodeles waltl]|uniref:Uncharacterized protein n=1 Tax=Pleurodeles waltl TaxID=8319 RepID=A0AAV7UHC2_PLEWA|nr:hypothetical protein NDU88_003786 [Pleurodeles waltl]